MIAWNVMLFIFKFVLLGLIYWVLWLMVRTIRREMAMRIGSPALEAPTGPGRLRIANPGGDRPERQGEIFDLRPENSLGADPDNDLVLADPYISGHHARLRWDGAGWWVEDLGSRNSTYVNQARCLPFTPQPLPPLATLKLGGMELILLE